MNENKLESYTPSEDEIKETEAMMGPEKAKLSALRERSAQLLKERGKDGYLESSYIGDRFMVSGKINDHSIILTIDVAGQEPWQGEVDGFNLSPEEAQLFINRYDGVWAKLKREDLEAAQKEELLSPGREKVLKDIGL
ncbi:MAG: hypothetical protein Q7K44_02920 [Candidatus Liptonbacteria bacterium]|nr:hypothetical protein [Candidatus Liptonbacteria bacterium]